MDENPYKSPEVQSPKEPSLHETRRFSANSPRDLWRHSLLGLIFGGLSVLFHRASWNAPIHWVTVGIIFFIYPGYFASLAWRGRDWKSIAVAIFVTLGSDITAGLFLLATNRRLFMPDYPECVIFCMCVYLGILAVMTALIPRLRRSSEFA